MIRRYLRTITSATNADRNTKSIKMVYSNTTLIDTNARDLLRKIRYTGKTKHTPYVVLYVERIEYVEMVVSV